MKKKRPDYDYYDRPRGCEKIFLRIIVGILLIFSTLFLLVKCEANQNCYVCTVKTQWFYGDFVVTSERDYPYCEVDEEWIDNFETINTYSDTLTKMVQTCKCR